MSGDRRSTHLHSKKCKTNQCNVLVEWKIINSWNVTNVIEGQYTTLHRIFLLDIYLSVPAVAPYISPLNIVLNSGQLPFHVRGTESARFRHEIGEFEQNLRHRTVRTLPNTVVCTNRSRVGFFERVSKVKGYAFSCHYPLRFHSHPLFLRFICALEDNLNLKVVKDHLVLLVQSNRVTGGNTSAW